jgi:hypothetical protein
MNLFFALIGVASWGLAIALGFWLLAQRRSSGVGRHLRESIVVHRVDGQSVKGVLVGEFKDCIKLTHVEFLGGETEVLLAGDILIPQSKIAFVQLVPARGQGASESRR